MGRVAYIQKKDEKYYMDYYVEVNRKDEDNVLVGSFCANRITVDRNSEDDDNTSGYVIIHVGENKMEFIADKIEGMECLREGDVYRSGHNRLISETDFGHYYIGCICDSEPIRFLAINPDAEWIFITEDERINSKFPTLFDVPTIGLAKKQIEKLHKTTEYKNAKLFLVPEEDIEFWDKDMKG